mgnify:CR=1 FL=1
MRWPSGSRFGDIDIAEESVQDAFTAAMRAVAVERHAAEPGGLDHHDARAIARSTGSAAKSSREDRHAQAGAAARQRRTSRQEEGAVRDDRLRLIFTCCHPALAHRRAGGADAAPARRADDGRDRARLPRRRKPTMAQRLVSAKAQDPRRRHPLSRAGADRAAGPAPAPCWPSIYLIFNEGYVGINGRSARSR